MPDTIEFATPPVIELVIGAQFSPLTKLTAGHYGLFWKSLGEEWTEPDDGPPIEDRFETFAAQHPGPQGQWQLRLEPLRLPGRFVLGHRDKHRLIQVQATRFHLNWRRNGVYPSYPRLIAEFDELFGRFTAFAESTGLGSVTVNQWELTYIDAFLKNEYWQTPADWPGLLPGVFGALPAVDGLALESRSAECVFEIGLKRGRVHVAARPGWWSQQPALLLETTARGPVGKGGAETLRSGLDLGHDTVLGTFLRLVPAAVQAKWGRTNA